LGIPREDIERFIGETLVPTFAASFFFVGWI